MRTIRLPARLVFVGRRLLAWGLLLAIPWLVWQEGVAPAIAGITDARARSYQSRALLVRYGALSAEMPALEARLAALDKASAAGREPIDKAGAALAATKLQADLQLLSAPAGVNQRSSQVLPVAEEAGFFRLGVALELTADIAGLQRLLHAIETAQPPLFVNELVVRGEPGANNQPMLGIRCQVVAYAPVKPEPKTARADK